MRLALKDGLLVQRARTEHRSIYDGKRNGLLCKRGKRCLPLALVAVSAGNMVVARRSVGYLANVAAVDGLSSLWQASQAMILAGG